MSPVNRYIPSLENTSTSHKLRLLSTPTNWMATYCPIKGRAHANVLVVPSSGIDVEREREREGEISWLLRIFRHRIAYTYRQCLDTMHTMDSVASRNYCFPHEFPNLAVVNCRSSHESLSAPHEPFVASADRRATMAMVPFVFQSIFVRPDFRCPTGHRWPKRPDRHVWSMTD